METRLDRLLQSIDPEVTMDEVSARVDKAMNSFEVPYAITRSWYDFKTLLMSYYYFHVQRTALQISLRRSPEPKVEWGRCCEMLIREFGPNGDRAAFEIVRTGTEGGLYRVLKSISIRMIEEYTQNEIRAKISHFWNPLSVNEQLSVTEEYLVKFRHLLPPELTEGNAARIKADFIKVLEEHPRMIKRLRKIGRNQ